MKVISKKTLNFNTLLIIAIIISALILSGCAPISPTSDSDVCTTGIFPPEGAERDKCYVENMYVIPNFNCSLIKSDKGAMIECLSSMPNVDFSYCDSIDNKELCYFSLAVVKGDLNLCTQKLASSDAKSECKIIINSFKNTCEHFTRTYQPGSALCHGSSPLHPADVIKINPEECNQITTESEYEFPSYRDRCFMASAFSLEDQKVCSSISKDRGGDRQKNICLIGAATSFGDCDNIPTTEKIGVGDAEYLVKDKCFESLAIRTKNLSTCLYETDYARPGWCVYTIASQNDISPEECASITNEKIDFYFGTMRDACYGGLAEFKKNVQFCDQISTDFVKANCIGSVGTIENCKKIPETQKPAGSYYFARDECIFNLINRVPDVESCKQTVSENGFNFCIDLLGRITGDKEVCQLIKDLQLKETCIQQATLSS